VLNRQVCIFNSEKKLDRLLLAYEVHSGVTGNIRDVRIDDDAINAYGSHVSRGGRRVCLKGAPTSLRGYRSRRVNYTDLSVLRQGRAKAFLEEAMSTCEL